MAKHFTKIAEGFDVQPCLDWLRANETTLPFEIRPTLPPGYRTLRGDYFGPEGIELWHSSLRALNGPPDLKGTLPSFFMCPPCTRVAPHRDNLGEHSKASGRPIKRYQLALQVEPAAYFRIGLDRARFRPGELWLCDIGGRVHEMNNLGQTERIVLSFDVQWPQFGGQLR